MNQLLKKIGFIYVLVYLLLPTLSQSQTTIDTTKTNEQKWNFHFQNTVITQYHPAFSAKYSGQNSLSSSSENASSFTTTLYFGAKLWNGAQFYFNPEISGGLGFSKTTGIAGFPNGEIYRVGDPSPHIFVGRAVYKQVFPLSEEKFKIIDDINQLSTNAPVSFLAIYAGKFCLMDYFDNNRLNPFVNSLLVILQFF